MLKQSFLEIFKRDLLRLKEEVMLYENEADLWLLNGTINNSAGNLCLHLIGNLNHFIGVVLGKSGYVRNRDSEFTLKNVPVQEILDRIEQTITVVAQSFEDLTDSDFSQNYPLKKHDQTLSTLQMLLHLVSHFNYHLGQINYHRRLLCK